LTSICDVKAPRTDAWRLHGDMRRQGAKESEARSIPLP
jgi:hypothetical protein